ncbi:hypothetical protein IPA_03110 [Ignicoccus pacificus DSM 13166]|uniref:Uncharacterized protein n=1 Tax=Ignicoccus pacificus DSM 13166 TaxID=940294 RepID=A0A977KAW6_9CREN|nr:hypothetical protein IPA_03110 [Ignicoccus pacificus DSM 13166]
MDNMVKAVAVGSFLLSIAIGLIDYKAFEGTVSPLTSAAAIASVAAFVALVLLGEDSPSWHLKLVEGLIWSALALDILHVIALALGVPVHKYATNILYFFFGYAETKEIKLFGLKPFEIGPKPFTAKSLAIDPASIMFVAYYLTWGRRKLNEVIKKKKSKKK